MSFRLFRVDVEVEIGFWLTALLLGIPLIRQDPGLILVWIPVVFLSILVHEFGHALAIQRHRIEPEITLHWMGGTTTWRSRASLGRLQHVIISLAGPFAGFFLAGVLYLLLNYVPEVYLLPSKVILGLQLLIQVNVGWGLLNLVPVLPLDGGHVLEHTLGPRRARLTAAISCLSAIGLAVFSVWYRMYFFAVFLCMSAFQSYQRYRNEPSLETPAAARRRSAFQEKPLPLEAAVLLRKARRAIEEERTGETMAAANEVLALSPTPPKSAMREALELIGWAKLLDGDTPGAMAAVGQAQQHGEPDAALVGAVFLALGNLKQARRVLEHAREQGDGRKEVVGPLVRVLVEQGEVARAAAVALDIIDSLSEEDARKMADLAFQNDAFDWSARLYEAIFRRNGHGEDAYGAARANAQGGNLERSLELLQRAVDAGFSDRTRAWSDKALEALKNGPLETVLPRP